MLVLSDLGDGAGGASLLASTASSAGILVHNSGDVLELKNATGAGVNANATGDAPVGIDYGMSHDFSSLLTGATDDARRFDSAKTYHAPDGLQYPARCIFIPFAESTAAYYL